MGGQRLELEPTSEHDVCRPRNVTVGSGLGFWIVKCERGREGGRESRSGEEKRGRKEEKREKV